MDEMSVDERLRRRCSGNPGDGKHQSNILALRPQRWPSYVGRLLEVRAHTARNRSQQGLFRQHFARVSSPASSRRLPDYSVLSMT